MEQEGRPEINAELEAKLEFADLILSGKYSGKIDDNDKDSHDPNVVFEGPILDYNDTALTEQDIAYAERWIESTLGGIPDEQPSTAFESADGETRFYRYDKELGNDGENKWYLSYWETAGSKPSYVLWPEEAYDWQLEMGYEDVLDNFSSERL